MGFRIGFGSFCMVCPTEIGPGMYYEWAPLNQFAAKQTLQTNSKILASEHSLTRVLRGF